MEERRRRQRLPWIEIQAEVKLRKGLWGSEWVTIEVVDYSSLGMGVRQIEGLSVKDKIELNLKLSTEVGDILADKVPAQIRHKRSTDRGMILGIEFDDAIKSATRESLLRIEGIVQKHLEVTNRLK